MALSFQAVQQAYKALHELKPLLPTLQVNSWPDDMANWEEPERLNPPLCTLLGYDKKQDDGWENLMFFVESPSEELITRFKEVATAVPNSFMCRQYRERVNPAIWIMGWF